MFTTQQIADAFRRQAIEEGILAVSFRKHGMEAFAVVCEQSAGWMRTEANRLDVVAKTEGKQQAPTVRLTSPE